MTKPPLEDDGPYGFHYENWDDFELWDEPQRGDPQRGIATVSQVWAETQGSPDDIGWPEEIEWDPKAIRAAQSDYYHKQLTDEGRRFRNLHFRYRVDPRWLIQQLRDQDHKCALCHRRIWWYAQPDLVNVTRKLEVDHVWPRSKGGVDCVCNYQLLCEQCNRDKGNAIPEGRGHGGCSCPDEQRAR